MCAVFALDPTLLASTADELVERFTSEVSERLRRLRLHHQLALFEHVDTLRQLDELVYHHTRNTVPASADGKNA